jgi:hypothetical protein
MSRSYSAEHFMQDAFNARVKKAIEASHDWYIVLVEEYQSYGGPEEGGWWRNHRTVSAYKQCANQEEAELLKAEIEKLAAELSAESRKEYGERCCRELNWLEARGLDADYLPEPDSETTYSVLITQTYPAELEYHTPAGYE